jgi:hypothetical protein
LLCYPSGVVQFCWFLLYIIKTALSSLYSILKSNHRRCLELRPLALLWCSLVLPSCSLRQSSRSVLFRVSTTLKHVSLIIFADLLCLALSRAFYKCFTQGVPSDIIWSSYVAHLSQAQPDRTFGPKQNAFVCRIPGESQDIGTQMAFTLPEGDGEGSGDVIRAILRTTSNLFACLTSST